MNAHQAALIFNSLIVIIIASCTIFGMINHLEGWGYSYFLLLAIKDSTGSK